MSNRAREWVVSSTIGRMLRLVEARGYVVRVEWQPQGIPGRVPPVVEFLAVHPEAPEHLHVGRSYDADVEMAAFDAAQALMASVGLDPEYA